MSIARPEVEFAYDLRALWATRKRVTLVLSERCDLPELRAEDGVPRVEGLVSHVAPSDAFVIIEERPPGADSGPEIHVPLAEVLSVHRPARHRVAREGR